MSVEEYEEKDSGLASHACATKSISIRRYQRAILIRGEVDNAPLHFLFRYRPTDMARSAANPRRKCRGEEPVASLVPANGRWCDCALRTARVLRGVTARCDP